MSDAITLDKASLREQFVFPTNTGVGGTRAVNGDGPCTYLCGNSLGLLSKTAESRVQREFHAWGAQAVMGHFSHVEGTSWLNMTDDVDPILAELVGAKPSEVACMSTLTANLHLMMSSFYKPTSERFKILCEGKAFPSDQYAFASQAQSHGFNPKEAVLELFPREGEYVLREEDILEVIQKQGSTIAVVIFSGIQYYTGQWFPMKSITKAAKDQGCICGWDLAHAIGNVPMSLHDWDVDFAVWCTYKYLNSGPGGIAGLFVHEKWDDRELPKYAGWWGNDRATRFEMRPTFSPIRGAQGFQQSNPSTLCIAALYGSLQLFQQAGMMPALRKRSLALTGHLESLLVKSSFYIPPSQVASRSDKRPAFTIITPNDPEARGAQLSLKFLPETIMVPVFDGLKSFGVIGDERNPDVIRLAPAPIYNTFEDCEVAARSLEEVFNSLS